MYLIRRRRLGWTRSLLLSPLVLELLELSVLLINWCLRWLGPMCRISHHLIEPILFHTNRMPSSDLSSGSEATDRHTPEPSSVVPFRHEWGNLRWSHDLRKSLSKGGNKVASGNPNLPCHLAPAMVAHIQLPRSKGVERQIGRAHV